MTLRRCILLSLLFGLPAFAKSDRVVTDSGALEGTGRQPTGVREFKGIPFAAPPTGDLRFAPPQPVPRWSGVRQATQFGARCMQQAVFGDMNFRAGSMSEDCLYLNVWTPAKSAREKLPVMVYFFGGGFVAGDGSEPRYDGESLAQKGIVTLTVNFRLGVFGFFAHPDLTQASPHHASGNNTLLDQVAALEWVRHNITAFGGDPAKITIAGESAGSFSVSALVASPLSKDLIAGAIGESGSLLSANPPVPLADAEQQGVKLLAALGTPDLAALRAMPADKLLEAAGKPGMPRFGPSVDGYFLPDSPVAIFAAGKQAHVPLLAGWNSEESNARAVLGTAPATPQNLEQAIARLYGAHADEIAKQYTAANDEEALQTATSLASDRMIAYSTWKWIDLAAQTGGKPVYRYFYARPRPPINAAMGNVTPGLAGGLITGQPAQTPPPTPRGAVHSAEIEYALGNLATNKVFAWTPDDYKVSAVMEAFFANFIRTGNPNGPGLPQWPAVDNGVAAHFMRIDVDTHAETEEHRERYLTLDKLAGQS